jgi:hypothetical protein
MKVDDAKNEYEILQQCDEEPSICKMMSFLLLSEVAYRM